MKATFKIPKSVIVISCSAIFLAGILVLGTTGFATQNAKKASLEKAYKSYTQKCLGCHVSVADPEKPGRTRDDWHLVVNVMHGYGLDLSDEESEQIIELLYHLRQGTEKEPG